MINIETVSDILIFTLDLNSIHQINPGNRISKVLYGNYATSSSGAILWSVLLTKTHGKLIRIRKCVS